AEQRFGARLDRLIGRHQARGDIGILADDRVDVAFDLHQLVMAHGLGMAEIETQAVGSDHRTLLRNMAAQNALECRVQQMSRGMVSARGLRRSPSTFRSTESPILNSPESTFTRWACKAPNFFSV